VLFLLVGVALGAGYVLLGRVPEPKGQVPAVVKVSYARSGDLAARPARSVIATGKLRPGPRKVRGRLSLHNPTDVPLEARPRALGRPGELDDLVVARITAAGSPIFDGPLRLLRQLHAQPFTVAPGRTARVRISVSLPGPAAARLWAGRRAAVRLEWRTAPAPRGG
jgi:hypothetical protein